MAKYKIVITEVETRTVKTQSYEKLRDRLSNEEGDNYGYVDTTEEKTIENKIYEQIVENQIDLKGVIDAFNKQPSSGSPDVQS